MNFLAFAFSVNMWEIIDDAIESIEGKQGWQLLEKEFWIFWQFKLEFSKLKESKLLKKFFSKFWVANIKKFWLKFVKNLKILTKSC